MARPRIVLLAGLVAMIASCSSSSPTGGGGGGGGGCTGSNANVFVCDFKFSPSASTISAGASINWTWKGAAAHNVTFTGGPVVMANSSTMVTGTYNLVFNTPGTYTYECNIHHFTGSITVN